MRRRTKRDEDDTPFEEIALPTFLPDETAGEASAMIAALEQRVAKLEEQLLAQYSALAAYATIAERAVETARAEARADLDRTRTTTLGLIDDLVREQRELAANVTALAAERVGSLSLH